MHEIRPNSSGSSGWDRRGGHRQRNSFAASGTSTTAQTASPQTTPAEAQPAEAQGPNLFEANEYVQNTSTAVDLTTAGGNAVRNGARVLGIGGGAGGSFVELTPQGLPTLTVPSSVANVVDNAIVVGGVVSAGYAVYSAATDESTTTTAGRGAAR